MDPWNPFPPPVIDDRLSGRLDMGMILFFIGQIVSEFRYVLMFVVGMDLFFLILNFLITDILPLGASGPGRQEVERLYRKGRS